MAQRNLPGTALPELVVDRAVALVTAEDRMKAEFEARISPVRKLGLPASLMPPLLDERRVKYFIPDSVFASMPCYDTCRVWQIGMHEEETVSSGGKILMTAQTRQQSKNESPRGILVAAGLLALDALRSNGIDLGHIVSLLRLSPYRMPADCIGGVDVFSLVLHAGDIKGSEDTMRELRDGTLLLKTVKEKDADGFEVERHVYTRAGGIQLAPTKPWMAEEY